MEKLKVNENVARFFGLKAVRRVAEQRGDASEARRLQAEADYLTPFLIRHNLESFGVQDLFILALLCDDEGMVLESRALLLSDLCGLKPAGLAISLNMPLNHTDYVEVVHLQQRIGTLERDGSFHFDRAPDLRTALAWKVATDGGRERIVSFDSDAASRRIINSIELVSATSYEIFLRTLSHIFVNGTTSRFSDTHYAAADLIWQVATREIGEEHPGFPIFEPEDEHLKPRQHRVRRNIAPTHEPF